MNKLKRWTIFYPDGKKDLIVNLNQIKNDSDKEHWKVLMDELTQKIECMTFDAFTEDKEKLEVGENAYTNYLLALCAESQIPILQYVEESHYWFLFSPENYCGLTSQQYKDIINIMPKMKAYGRKHNFCVGYLNDDKFFDNEQNYDQFSHQFYHDFYGKAMKVEVSEQGRRR